MERAISQIEVRARRRWGGSFAGLWLGRAGVPGKGDRKTRSFGLRPTSLGLAAGEPRTVVLAFEDAAAVKKLRRLLKRKSFRRGTRAEITVRASDAGGNSTTRKVEVRLARKRKGSLARTGAAEPAAAVQLGQVAPADPQDCESPRNNVQAATGPGPSYEVPADGTITRWSHRGDTDDDLGSGRLQIWRRAGGTDYTLVGRSSVETFASGVTGFASSIPVRRGDLLGLRGNTEAGCTFDAAAGDLVRFETAAGDPEPGATRVLSDEGTGLRVNVAATLETTVEPVEPVEPDDRLALDVEAAGRQRVNAIALTLSCPEEACEAAISGAVLARRERAGKRVFIAFTGKARRRVKQLRQQFPKPGMLKPVRFEHTLRELEERQEEMIADRERFRAAGPPFPGVSKELYDLDIDVTRNAPVVILEHPTDAAAAALRERYGSDVIVKAGALMDPDAPCNSRFDCLTLRSGLATQTATGGCSTAFVAYTGREIRPGTLGILSAAHCGGPNPDKPSSDLGADRRHGTPLVRYGTVQREQLFGRLDAEWHQLTPAHFNSHKALPWIYVDHEERNGRVKDRGKWIELTVGSTVCKSGKTTNFTCGEVLSKNFSAVPYVPSADRFVATNVCSGPGDSGAGVYAQIGNALKPPPDQPGRFRRFIALGIHSGSNSEKRDCGDDGYGEVFGHIQYVEQLLDVKVAIAKG